jgi:hypothetical protein
MIIAKLTGGIGNQMFQYAAGKRLAIRNNSELKLDITHYDNKVWPNGLPYRSMDLPIFNIDLKFADKKEIARFKNTSPSLVDRVKKKVINFFDPHLEVIEPHFHFYPPLLDLKGNIYIDGYWQCEKYFKDIEDVIRKEFSIKTTLGSEGKALLDKIRSVNSVCLNVRRQEFASNRYINQFVGESYINKAVDLIARKVTDPHFFVFSDDLSWCKENIKLDHKTTFVEEHLYGEQFRDCLYFMTQCKHNIIPNSTFGWWGAWLNENVQKIVIAPDNWLNDPTRNTKDVIPESWIRL